MSARRHPCSALRHLQRVASLVARRLEGCAGWRQCLAFVRQQEATPGSPWHLGPGEAPLSDSQVRRYLRRADSEIRASVSKDRQRLFEEHLARRELLSSRKPCVGSTAPTPSSRSSTADATAAARQACSSRKCSTFVARACLTRRSPSGWG